MANTRSAGEIRYLLNEAQLKIKKVPTNQDPLKGTGVRGGTKKREEISSANQSNDTLRSQYQSEIAALETELTTASTSQGKTVFAHDYWDQSIKQSNQQFLIDQVPANIESSGRGQRRATQATNTANDNRRSQLNEEMNDIKLNTFREKLNSKEVTDKSNKADRAKYLLENSPTAAESITRGAAATFLLNQRDEEEKRKKGRSK